jgi:subtilisin-like proprotein convertase family protein
LARRVIITNDISHAAPYELTGVLNRNGISAVLDNHSANAGENFVYDDSEEGNVPGAHTSDGPGSLMDFAGKQAMGQWLLAVQSTNQPGTNQGLWISLEPQQDPSGGLTGTLAPGGCRRDFIGVSASVTNLLAMVTVMSGTGPVSLQVLPIDADPDDVVTVLVPAWSTESLQVDRASTPPIHSGTYAVRLCNLGPDAADFSLLCSTVEDPRPVPFSHFVSTARMPIPDDSTSEYTMTVTNIGLVDTLAVGARIDHPRISDLVLSLVSPQGHRVLLQENRGAATEEGMGTDRTTTNVTTVSWTGGPEAFTNVIETGQSAGTVTIDYDFYSLPDTMHVYYEDTLLFDSGLVSGSGRANLSYGPGSATFLTVVMNQGGNSDTNTAWFYRAISTRLIPIPLTFTENTNLTVVPIKFAPVPLTNINYSAPGTIPAEGIFYQPEESLAAFVGEPAYGKWKLEVQDTRAGATNPTPALISWQLDLRLRPAFPLTRSLTAGESFEESIAPRQTLWFSVDVPPWASFATNELRSASSPVDLLFNSLPPANSNPTAVPLLVGSLGGIALLQTNGTPALAPQTRYYLGVQNTNDLTVSFSLQVDFDLNHVTELLSGTPLQAQMNDPSNSADYYRFVISTNSVRAQFELKNLSENLTLFARKGPPPPGPGYFDYVSENSWTNDELIVLFDYSSPVALSPGDWYLTVVNPSAKPATYTILATEFDRYGTNLTIREQSATADSFCFTWASLPGVHYFVEGTASVSDPDWRTISPTLTAVDDLSSYCVSLPSPYQYFRVCEGLVLVPEPILISSVSWSISGALLQWSAESGSRFKVEWSPSLAAPAWSAFTNTIESASSSFQFLDDGSQSGGLDQTRFYRLMRIP